MRYLGQQTANLGSFDGTFWPQPRVSIELPTLAVLMAPLNLSWCFVNKLPTLAVLMALFSHADFLLKFPKYTVILSIFEPEKSSLFLKTGQDFARIQLVPLSETKSGTIGYSLAP